MTGPRLLVVMNEEMCPPASFGPWIEAVGVELDVCPAYAEGSPPPIDGYDGLMVLGGEMGANDDDTCPWLPPTRELIREAVRRDVPFLGICLGYQLAARALGGRVTKNPSGTTTALLPVHLEKAGHDDPMLQGLDGHPTVQWNLDVVRELPADAVRLATAPDGTVQAARYGSRAWGVQFHPEAGPGEVRRWGQGKGPEGDPPQHVVERLIADVDAADAQLRDSWSRLATRFAAEVVAQRERAAAS